ncbi:hypothetical protein HG15A2_42620 [Adhaeretor mobilis]|uniref:Uncharacterized protein n=1 Tax=Adhaeretor mobilis TaxID=1930276 RepID=A0A517N1A2_9BACT|nr:hypothetical protein HG15A2_42620 [Adhaeretor mobilis]
MRLGDTLVDWRQAQAAVYAIVLRRKYQDVDSLVISYPEPPIDKGPNTPELDNHAEIHCISAAQDTPGLRVARALTTLRMVLKLAGRLTMKQLLSACAQVTRNDKALGAV